MTITITANELVEKGCWEKFCEVKGMEPLALREGMSHDTEFTMTEQEAKDIGILYPEW